MKKLIPRCGFESAQPLHTETIAHDEYSWARAPRVRETIADREPFCPRLATQTKRVHKEIRERHYETSETNSCDITSPVAERTEKDPFSPSNATWYLCDA